MVKGAQDAFLEIGRSGCLFLCLLKIAEIETEKPINVLDAYQMGLVGGYIKRNCFVLDATGLLEELLNRYISYKKFDGDYLLGGVKYVIKMWSMKRGNEKLTHFVLFNGTGQEIFDPCLNNFIRANGKIESCRLVDL